MSDSIDLEAATLEARAARERLMRTIHTLQARLDPASLLDEVVETVRTGATDLARTTADAARRRPGVATAIAAVATLLLLRRPMRRFGRWARRRD